MAAPVTTVRQAPAGIKLDDGFSTKIAFNRDPDVSLWEKSITPPGIDGGDPIDTVTMHNLIWRTMAPRKLKTMTPFTFSAAYDPIIIGQLVQLINMEGSITLRFPDGSTWDFFGYLQKADFSELVEGTQPEGTFTIVPTNQDPVTGAEQDPVLTYVAGT